MPLTDEELRRLLEAIEPFVTQVRADAGGEEVFATYTTVAECRAIAEAAAKAASTIRECATCRSLVGCSAARVGGPDDLKCWEEG